MSRISTQTVAQTQAHAHAHPQAHAHAHANAQGRARHPERGDLGLLGASLLGAGLVVASLLLLVFVRVGQTRAGYAVHDLRAERTRLAQERAALEVERASLLRPARLSQWARTEAGLAPVEPVQLVVVAPQPASAREGGRE